MDAVFNQNLHPITILMILDANKQRIPCKTLLDQCCTDTGLISWELAKMLKLPTTEGNPHTFVTAAGTFTTKKMLKIMEAVLPCLLTNCTFLIDLMIIPEECSTEMNYGTIIGQESMRLLNLDTSLQDNTISWGEKEISMFLQDYWTAKQIK